jgi:hypothetical protein
MRQEVDSGRWNAEKTDKALNIPTGAKGARSVFAMGQAQPGWSGQE